MRAAQHRMRRANQLNDPARHVRLTVGSDGPNWQIWPRATPATTKHPRDPIRKALARGTDARHSLTFRDWLNVPGASPYLAGAHKSPTSLCSGKLTTGSPQTELDLMAAPDPPHLADQVGAGGRARCAAVAGPSAGSVQRRVCQQPVRALQQFFRWLAEEEQIPDPMARLRAPKVTEKPVPVSTSGELSALERTCHGYQRSQIRKGHIRLFP